MILRVELHSVITRQIVEIARAWIANIGSSEPLGNYPRRRCAVDAPRIRTNASSSAVFRREATRSRHSTSDIWSPKHSKQPGYGE
jgi:hypothetical protein